MNIQHSKPEGGTTTLEKEADENSVKNFVVKKIEGSISGCKKKMGWLVAASALWAGAETFEVMTNPQSKGLIHEYLPTRASKEELAAAEEVKAKIREKIQEFENEMSETIEKKDWEESLDLKEKMQSMNFFMGQISIGYDPNKNRSTEGILVKKGLVPLGSEKILSKLSENERSSFANSCSEDLQIFIREMEIALARKRSSMNNSSYTRK